MNHMPNPRAFERALIAGEAEPTTEDSIVRYIHRLPISQQIAFVKRVVSGEDWFKMAHNDADRMEAALDTFADDMLFAARREDVRLHGAEVRA